MKKGTKTIPKYIRILIPSALILIWFAVGGIGGPFFGKIAEVSSNDQSTFLPASAESTKVNAEIQKFRDEKSIPAIVVFSDKGSELSSESIASITTLTERFTQLSEVSGNVSPPIVSDDKKAAIVVVNIDSGVEYKEFIPALRERIENAKLPVDAQITGPAGFLSDLADAFAGIDGLLLGVALAVVFIILLIVYRSPILPFLVLINSMFALCASILVVYYCAKAGIVSLNGQVQGILFILVIGAATDYALLFIARYREELMRHSAPYEAILTSWRRSVEPILAAGGTVIAGLLCLLLSDLNSNKALGPVGAIGIVMAILATLSFLPSLVLPWGRVLFWPQVPHELKTKRSTMPKGGLWSRVATFVQKNARFLWIGISAAMLLMAFGLVQLRADGVSQSEFILGKSEARDGQETLNAHFPDGSGTPVQVIIAASARDAAVEQLESDKDVDSVSVVAVDSPSGTMPLGRQQAKIKQEIRTAVAEDLTKQKAEIRSQIEAETFGAPKSVTDSIYESAIANLPTADSIVNTAYPFKDAQPKRVDGNVVLEVTLKSDADSDAAQATVQRIRAVVHEIDRHSLVGGISAVQLDTRLSAERDRTVVIPSVLLVITLILMLLLRSLVAPILLLVTTILSFAAILGASAFVFNDLFGFAGADPSVVLFGFIFLVALGIDYNIFLMTRVREESLQLGVSKGVSRGLIATGGVITSAGVVLAATFAALAVIPILFLVQLAFIVAVGVLVDTIVVRSLLVPALALDIGRTIWWPSRNYKD